MNRMRALALTGLVTAAIGFVGGCSDDASLGRTQPVISVDLSPIDFGVVPVGATKRQAVTIRNIGTGILQLSRLQITASGSSLNNPFFLSQSEPIEIAPGGQRVIDVAFSPPGNEGGEGRLTANFGISSDDPETPEVSIELQGEGTVGQIVLQPASLDLQNTTVGRSRSAELVVQNLGTTPVEGARLVGDGFARPQNFRLTGLVDFSQPAAFALDARGRQVLVLTYVPLGVGEDHGIVRIETCGPRCGPEVRVTASANDALVRLDPPSVDFGAVGINESASQAMRVENVSDTAVTIESVTVAGNAAFAVEVPGSPLPATVGPNDSLGLTLTFRPLEAIEAQAAVVVRTNFSGVPELQATLTGQGDGPQFVVTPAAVSFGTERGAGTYQRTVLLNNAGSSRVQVSAIDLANGSASLTLGVLPRMPVSLGPGESLVVPVIFAPTEVGMATADLRITSDFASQPSTTVPVTAAMSDSVCELVFDRGQVRFGVMPVGHRRDRTVRVTNAGPDVCRIESGAFRSPADPEIQLVSGSTLPVGLYPLTATVGLTAIDLNFTYGPTSRRTAKATYVLSTADEFFPERTVSLLGQSEEYPQVLVRPGDVDFGAMIPNVCPVFTDNVTLFNVGTTSVRHAASRLVLPDGEVLTTEDCVPPLAAEFCLSTSPQPLQTLAVGDVFTYELGYLARDLNQENESDAVELEIEIEGLPQALVVPMTGRGSSDPRRTETFQQVDNKEVDVLFVIDDSCSMAENQRQVAQNFDQFIDAADQRQVDFQLGITTTDTFTAPGALVGPVISRATQDFKGDFQMQAAVGILGSATETGLEALKAALDEADRGNGFNADLIRPEAALVVIIVSDEDDQSTLGPSIYANDLIQRTPNGVLVAAVSGQQGGCSAASGTADPAPKYETFLSFFGDSVSASICDDWGATLADLGGEAFGLKRAFRLAIEPDGTKDITVELNGTEADPATYGIQGRDLVFQTAPPEGTVIVIEYSPDC